MVRKGKDGALHLRQIRHYMETGSYLPSVHITEKNGIRKSSKKFLLKGNLHYCSIPVIVVFFVNVFYVNIQ